VTHWPDVLMYFTEFQSILLCGMWCVHDVFTATDTASIQRASSYAIFWWV